MKKIFKNSFMALAVLALGFSACTEEVEYTPVDAPANDQVYFSNTNSAKVELLKEATSLEITLQRQTAGGELEVPIIFDGDSLAKALCIAPDFVKFDSAATQASYVIELNGLSAFVDGADGSGSGYDKFFNVSLAIDDTLDLYTTPYGDSAFAFEAGVPAPWSEWEEMSGTYNFALYVSGAYPIPVYYREHMLDDTRAQFLLGTTAIGVLSDITIEYNKATGMCQVPAGQAFLTNATYGPVFVADLVNYPLVMKDANGNPVEMTYEDYPCTYDAETGLFTLNLIYYVDASLGSAASGYFAYGVETIQLDGFTQYDYSLIMNYVGNYIDNAGTNNAVINVAKGADVSQYLMAVVSADEDANAAVQGMLKGTVPCDTLTESGYYAYPMTESGAYKALAITFDANGEPCEAHSTDFEFWLAGDSNPWESLGYAMYTEDCLTTFFNVANETYPVEVRQHKDYPGLFRVIHPYAAYGADTSKEYFIEIDATDPEAVIIPGVYGTGLDVGKGEVSLTSMAYYYMATQGATKEDVKDAGYTGVLAENVITFPVKGLLISMANYENGGFYSSNVNGMFKLDMSNMTAEYPEMPEDSEASEAPAARVSAERGVKNLEGGIKFGNRFKKIDNSFLTPTDAVIE